MHTTLQMGSSCVCEPLIAKSPLSACFEKSRGVWHLHPTTLNEAVDAGGKRDLISPVYLQMRLAWAIAIRSLQSLVLNDCIHGIVTHR